MTGTLLTTAYGPAATESLHRVVAAAKDGDPLAPVTVVVPTNYVGVAARRALGSGRLGPLTPVGVGVAGVTFLTAYRLAELLGAPALALAGRRPVSSPVLAAALRAVLAREPGVFAAVAEHPATEQALVASYRELAALTDAQLQALTTAGPRTADVVRVCRAARRALVADWFDEQDLMTSAEVAIAAETPLLADVGTVVVHLPQDVSPAAVSLLRTVGARVPLVVVAGITGNARADRAVLELAASIGGGGGAPDPPAVVTEPCGTRVVSTSDPDDEVRAVVRLVVESLRDGVPLARMAVLYGATEPYARLVHEQLAAAGIPHNGAAVRTLAGSALGRGLLGLVGLPDRDFHRHDVMALLASVPVRHRGVPVPSSRWERITRDAGIVRGPAQWHDRLERHARRLRHELDTELAVTDRDPRPVRFERELRATESLLAFVHDLVAAPATGAQAQSWRALVAWAQQLITGFLGGEAARATWPADEVRAAEKIEAALERLAGLDAVEASPGVDVFRRTLDLELDADLGRVGRLGDGLLMGHVALGLGLDLDRVFVCGLAEGTFPARVREDSLLPDTDRKLVGGALPLRTSRVDDDHRRLLAALASARDERVLLYPRGDLRRTTERMPSRFLLTTAGTLAGEPLYAEQLLAVRAEWCTQVPSFAAGLARLVLPATDQEHRLRSLLQHTASGGRVADHELHRLDPALGAGIDCVLARASRQFTRFDGNVAGAPIPVPGVAGAAVSPTRLEVWAKCPFDYFMEHVLRVEVPERPEEVYEISPLERGSLVHAVLDDFFTEVLERHGGEPFAGTWSAADRARLRAIGEQRCDAYEALGVTGRRVFWQRDRARILVELDRFLDADADRRAEHGLVTLATELRFGLPHSTLPELEVPLSDGRTVHLRGAADRVDRDHHGALWVLDYKTGKPFTLDADDPCAAGRRLQLPVYAHAARAAFGADLADGDDEVVGAAYWFVSTRGNNKWEPLTLDHSVAARFDTVVCTILDGIAGGVFPCAVEPPRLFSFRGRTYADPDDRGTRDRYREWLRKQEAPEVRAYVGLTPGALDGMDDGMDGMVDA